MKRQLTLAEKRSALKALLAKQQTTTTSTKPVSFGQERLWFINELTGSSAAYNLRLAIRLVGNLKRERLALSINQIVKRHAILRARFDVHENKPRLMVMDGLELPLVVVSAENADQVEQLADEEAQRPFNLNTGPLIRSKLVEVSATEHVLLVTMHHTVSDGWSLGIFMQELAKLYDAGGDVSAAQLPDLPLQYSDFSQWQREQFDSETPSLQQDIAYWRDNLIGHQPALEMPTDRPRPPMQTFVGDRHYFTLNEETTQAIRALQVNGVTEFMLLIAAYKVLLYRYSGQNDILVGTPVAGRNRANLEGLIGLFINTLILRSDVQGDVPFQSFLEQVKQTSLGAFSHQNVPFEKLVEAVQPVRDPSRNPLFQVLFTLQNSPQPVRSLSELSFEVLTPKKGTAQFDLGLVMWSDETQLRGYFEYNVALYDSETIARMVDQFATLLADIGRAPKTPISQLALLSSAEKQLLLQDWNDTDQPYDLTRLLADRIEQRAAETPDRDAATCAGVTLTYAELNGRANAVAHAIQAAGVQSNQLVGLAAERSLEMLIGLLGILKAGAAYVPIDPDYPPERVAYMIETADIDVMVTQSALVERYDSALSFVLLDELASEVRPNPTRTTKPTDRAYIIFTSGSTGKPKGVEISQNAIVNFLLTMADAPGMTAEDVVLAVTTISFDIAGLELYLPLLTGAHCIIATSAQGRDSYALADMLDEHNISIMQATPATWRMLLAADWGGKPNLKMLSGGEALPQDLATQLMARGGELWNVYGPTEATVWATIWRVTEADVGNTTQPVTIGKPIANTRCFILDKHGEPAPIGVIGDLFIGGVQVAQGYLARPDLTSERFVPSPLASHNTTLYRTGDLARYRADGTIEFLGREDFQVKIRGFRIELGEIEAQLVKHAQLREVVVLARPGRSGEHELIAYVVGDAQAQDLRDFLAQTLPAYMIPGRFVSLDAFPLTANGKVNRRALPEPDDEPIVAAEFEAPRNSAEKVVADAWIRVLGLEKVSVHDNFFELGGESILGIQVIGQLRKAGMQAKPEQLFQYQTIAELAHALAPDLEATSYGLTAQQQAIESGARHVLSLRAPEPLDIAKLREAAQAVVMQHDVLRMQLDPRGQSLAEKPAVCVVEVGSVCDTQDAVLHLLVQDAFRVQLSVSAQHLDAASLPMLVSDISAAYDGLAAIDPTAQFTAWLKRLASDVDGDVLVPHQLPSAALSSSNGQHSQVTRLLSAEQSDQLRSLPDAYSVSADVVLLTAIAQVLETPVWLSSFQRHNRFHDYDATRTLGNLRSELPLDVLVSAESTPADAIQAVKQAVKSAERWSFAFATQQYKGDATYPHHNPIFTFYPEFEQDGFVVTKAKLHEPSSTRHFTAGWQDGQLQITVASLSLSTRAAEQQLDQIESQLDQLLAHCHGATDDAYDASDFIESDIDADELGAFLSRFGD